MKPTGAAPIGSPPTGGGTGKPKRAPKKRKAAKTNSSDFDPNVKMKNRVFELTMFTPISEGVYERKLRIRVAEQALEDNVFDVGEIACYTGMVSEKDGKGKWSGYSWGHVPVSLLAGDWSHGYAREVFPELEKNDDAKS